MDILRRVVSALTAVAVMLPAGAASSRPPTAQHDAGTVPEGLSGEALMIALGERFRPSAIITSMLGDNSIWCVFARCDSDASGNVIDRYSAMTAPPVDGGREGCHLLANDAVVSPEWWAADDHGYGSSLRHDLYNLVPCNFEVAPNKLSYPPGQVAIADYTNGYWSSGRGYLGGVEVNFYAPPRGYEGDFARIVMYMITVYPCSRWSGLALNYCADTRCPGLQPYACRQLMAWHNADPVSDRERLRNDVIAGVQGNRNPFVDYPDLADYIWGNRAGENYEPPGGDVTPGDNPSPLRAVYHLSDGGNVELTSPYVPAGSRWAVDGKEVDCTAVPLSQLGPGIHELSFVAPGGARGKVLIRIEP